METTPRSEPNTKSLIVNLNELHAVEEWVCHTADSWTFVVRNRWGTISLIASDEDGGLFFTRVATDDPDDVQNGYVDGVPGVETGWPLELLWPRGTRAEDWSSYERVGAPFTSAGDAS
jgi:hypothetical protein